MNAGDSTPEDPALVAAALRGEERAFTALMRRHKDATYRFVRRYVGDSEEAFDVVQEAFVAAWRSLGSYDQRRPFAVWLRRIALNKCRDWHRRRVVRKFFYTAEALDEESAASIPTGPGENPDLAELDAAIAALPPMLKEALLLTYFEGLSHQEAAKHLRSTPKAIEVRVYRAKRRLADKLTSKNE